MMDLFGWRKKALRPIPVQVDLHSHLLPGLDDGVQSLEESMEIIRLLAQHGFRKVITTPHVMSDFYPNESKDIREKCAQLSESVKQEGIPVIVEAAAEYYLDEIFLERIAKGSEFLTFGKNYLLFETSFINEPTFLKEAIFRMNTLGYQPVLAHPERYMYLASDPKRIEDLLNMQVLFQINLNSVTGYYSSASKKLAVQLMEKGLVHFVGSDCHNIVQMRSYLEAWQHKHISLLDNCTLLNNSLDAARPGATAENRA